LELFFVCFNVSTSQQSKNCVFHFNHAISLNTRSTTSIIYKFVIPSGGLVALGLGGPVQNIWEGPLLCGARKNHPTFPRENDVTATCFVRISILTSTGTSVSYYPGLKHYSVCIEPVGLYR